MTDYSGDGVAVVSAGELSETVRIARDLIRFDTSNRGNGDANPEAPAAEYVAAYLRELGLRPEIYESAPGRTTVIARVPGREKDLPALVLHGHLDVVPADPANWDVDPFAGEIRDGMLWGRGAVDMKNMDAMILTAVAEILRAGELPRREIILAFFADEENGGVFGSIFMAREHPEVFAGAQTAISEVGGYSIYVGEKRAYLVQAGEKTLDWIKLRARGSAAHGSLVWHDNAITKLAAALQRLGEYDWEIRLCDTTSRQLRVMAELLGLDPDAVSPLEIVERLGHNGRFVHSSLRTTANATGLVAGYKHNVIPDVAEALVDVRALPGRQEEALRQLQEVVGRDIEIVSVHSDIGLEVPFEGELVDAMTNALLSEDPDAHVVPYLLAAGTDNKALAGLGIKGYGFAPLQLPPELNFPALFHGANERVPLAAIDFGQRVLVHLLRNY